MQISGTEGYAENAEKLIKAYESIPFDLLYSKIMHLVAAPPAKILDIGCGTGRDAAGFAALGHHVTALEPTDAFRNAGRILHPSPNITWLDDGLPKLERLVATTQKFDLILMRAVWMHLDLKQRQTAMPIIAKHLKPKGKLVLSLRHGPVPEGRRMFPVTAEETIALAETEHLKPIFMQENTDSHFNRKDVSWTLLAFAGA